MNRLLKAAVAAVCALGFVPLAQAQTTTITASSLKMGGVAIPAGLVTFTPVSSLGIPIPFAVGGGGLNDPSALPCTITTGALSGCNIPDAELTNPMHLLYQITITRTSDNKQFTMQAVPGITGTTWALDHYAPSNVTSALQTAQVTYAAAAPPASGNYGSFYVRSNGNVYVYIANAPVLFAGGVTSSAIQTALAGLTGCATSGNLYSPASNTCVAPTSGGGSVTSGSVQTALTGLTGCSTAGYVYLPQSNTCVVVSSVGSADALTPIQYATQVQVYSSLAAKREGSFNFPYTGKSYVSFGDSITACSGVTFGTCYISYLATAVGATNTSFALGGDQGCDMSRKVLTNANPGDTTLTLYSAAIGTNDSNNKGMGGYEATFNLCHQAAVAWLGTRSAYKVAASAASSSGTWTAFSTFAGVTGATSTTGASSKTFTLTTYGNPIYLWYELYDSGTGTFTVAVDGGTAQTVNAYPATAMATANGATDAPGLLRIPVAAGSHSIVAALPGSGGGTVTNILNRATVTEGVVQDTCATAVSNAGYWISDYAGVTPGQVLTIGVADTSPSSSYGMVFFDSSHVRLAGCPGSASLGSVGFPYTAGQTLTVPSGAAYVKMSGMDAILSTQTLSYTSGGGGGGAVGTVTLLAVGTSAPHNYYISYPVLVAGVPYIQGDTKSSTTAQYTSDILANVNLLKSDGLDVRFVDIRSTLQNGALSLYQGAANLHPNAAGHLAMTAAYVLAAQLPPALSVTRGTPLSSSQGCTPRDTWSYAGYVYGCQSFGLLQRVATATF